MTTATLQQVLLWALCLMPFGAIVTLILIMTFNPEKRTCPYCAEVISVKAKVCRQCMKKLVSL